MIIDNIITAASSVEKISTAVTDRGVNWQEVSKFVIVAVLAADILRLLMALVIWRRRRVSEEDRANISARTSSRRRRPAPMSTLRGQDRASSTGTSDVAPSPAWVGAKELIHADLSFKKKFAEISLNEFRFWAKSQCLIGLPFLLSQTSRRSANELGVRSAYRLRLNEIFNTSAKL